MKLRSSRCQPVDCRHSRPLRSKPCLAGDVDFLMSDFSPSSTANDHNRASSRTGIAIPSHSTTIPSLAAICILSIYSIAPVSTRHAPSRTRQSSSCRPVSASLPVKCSFSQTTALSPQHRQPQSSDVHDDRFRHPSTPIYICPRAHTNNGWPKLAIQLRFGRSRPEFRSRQRQHPG